MIKSAWNSAVLVACGAAFGAGVTMAAQPLLMKANEQWLGFAGGIGGGLIGGLLTLGAGWLAWSGVQQTIEKDDARSLRSENATINVIETRLNTMLEIANIGWEAIDKTLCLPPHSPRAGHQAALAMQMLTALTTPQMSENVGRIRILISDINAIKHDEIEFILKIYDMIATDINKLEHPEGEPQNPIMGLAFIRVGLSHIALAASVYKNDYRKMFEGRTHISIQQPTFAADLREIYRVLSASIDVEFPDVQSATPPASTAPNSGSGSA